MRKIYYHVLQQHFHAHLTQTRIRLSLTHTEISERLLMGEHSDQTHQPRAYYCDAVTLVIYLVYYCEDVPDFLGELRSAMEAAAETVTDIDSTVIPPEDYRVSIPVQTIIHYPNESDYPLCPRCGCSLDREYLSFCNCCGQKLAWSKLKNATVLRWEDWRNQQDPA